MFEYEIPVELAEVNVPGDWIIRKGSSREQLMKAFETSVRECTQRPITSRRQEIRRDVIVARGRFSFKPLANSYDDSWIHVFSDELDPDERGGGGTGSLDEFLRNLGDVPLNQQVIDETQGPKDIKVKYGWHYSGYIRKLKDDHERAAKLRMVLDNLARQTGLELTIERRTVSVWQVVDENKRTK
jgi:hypothetical protein